MPRRTRTVLLAVAGALTASLTAAPAALAYGKGAPAGGAAIGQVIIATVGAMVLTAVMLVLVAGHRTGRLPIFARLASTSTRAAIRGRSPTPRTTSSSSGSSGSSSPG